MHPPTPDQPPAAPSQPVRLLRLLLGVCIGLLVVFVGLVLLIGMEGLMLLYLESVPPPDRNLPIYMVFRGSAYLVVAGLMAWAIHWLAAPPRRRRYWIALGVGTALLASPAGPYIMIYATFAVIYLLGIYR
ncbi:MAG: hypothetical protein KG075_15970 [Alphaproteobacteria bacterium]|nr:hypothetical protein [Alphaproteobacteria bacterium]